MLTDTQRDWLYMMVYVLLGWITLYVFKYTVGEPSNVIFYAIAFLAWPIAAGVLALHWLGVILAWTVS